MSRQKTQQQLAIDSSISIASNDATSTRYPKMAQLTRAVECNVIIGGTEAYSKGDIPCLILRKLTSLITL